jgi:hemerythrin-like domain-containing protein
MKCAELIVEDHSILCRGLNILDGMIRKLEAGERIEIADVIGILKFIRVYGLEYHQNTAEKVLFPALLRAAPQATSVCQLVPDHSELRSLVVAADNALRSRRAREFVASSRRLTILLRSDFQKEEMALREVEGNLSREDDHVIAAEFANNRKLAEGPPNLPRLELKYTPRPIEKPLVAARDIGRAREASPYR